MSRMLMSADHVPRDHGPSQPMPRKQYPRWGNRCPHVVIHWEQVPHPRYGDAVAHYEQVTRPDPDCGCAR